jgi:DNA adenine methylase
MAKRNALVPATPAPLMRIEQARQMLAECVRVDEAKSIRDKAAAVDVSTRRGNHASEDFLIRYPGSKDKIARLLMGHFPSRVQDPLFQPLEPIDYREPFFGGGAVGLRLLEQLPPTAKVWLNDKDFGMVCLWKSVMEASDELTELVRSFTPTVDSFYDFKEQDARKWEGVDHVQAGFRKFVLHQISFSGNGAMAGGPIGGREQRSEYNVRCRWNPTRHCIDIKRISRLFRSFRSVRISTGDFGPLIKDAPPNAFVYADPPYYKAGPQLYKYAMTDDDHRRLASELLMCRAPWVLSYDDHPFIRGIYADAEISSVEMLYTTAVSSGPRRKNSELVIKPRVGARQAA